MTAEKQKISEAYKAFNNKLITLKELIDEIRIIRMLERCKHHH